MTENQRIEFSKQLQNITILADEKEKQDTIEIKKLSKWLKNIYQRYIYAIKNEKEKFQLPKEHIETLEKFLEKENLTNEEFLKIKGDLNKLIELIKNNQNLYKNMGYNELKNLQVKLTKEKLEIEKKLNPRQKKIYKLSTEEVEKMSNEAKKIKTELKKINEEMEKRKPENNEFEFKKIEELQRKKYKNEIAEIENSYETTLKEQTEKLKQEYDKKIADLNKKYEKELNEKDSENIKKLKKQEEKLKQELPNIIETERKIKQEEKKNIIIELLLKKPEISLTQIREELKKHNLDISDIKTILNDIKEEIPGITKEITIEGNDYTYGIKNDAIQKLTELKNIHPCPQTTNIKNGKIKFIVRSDLHLYMKNKDIIKTIYPYLDFSTMNSYAPIIDLGDLANTYGEFTYQDWKNKSTETIKQSYEFYKNYAKTISENPKVTHYSLFGNHEEHPYLAGVDPLEVMFNYCDNCVFVGSERGKIKISDIEIGLYHDKKLIEYPQFSKSLEIIKKEAQNYVFTLFGHYHLGKINPEDGYAIIKNGIENPILITAKIVDGEVESMYAEHLYLTEKQTFKKIPYTIEIYNKKAKTITYKK